MGHEVFLNLPDDDAKLASARVLERVCADVKRLDPDHLLIAVVASNTGIAWVERNYSSVDITASTFPTPASPSCPRSWPRPA